MARKKEPSCVTERYPFPTRLRALMEDRGVTQKALAAALGVRPQTVSLYCQGQSFPDVNRLADLARFFGVSSDYLTGISEIPSQDADIQTACRTTGLSADAVSQLQVLSEHHEMDAFGASVMGAASDLISSMEFLQIATNVTAIRSLGAAAERDENPDTMMEFLYRQLVPLYTSLESGNRIDALEYASVKSLIAFLSREGDGAKQKLRSALQEREKKG